MTTVKISITIPKDILRKLDEFCIQTHLTSSKLISRILEEKFGGIIESEDHKYPTVLWKLESTGYLKLRSPRLRGRMIGESWIVEEVRKE